MVAGQARGLAAGVLRVQSPRAGRVGVGGFGRVGAAWGADEVQEAGCIVTWLQIALEEKVRVAGSQHRLAELTGVDQATISRILRGDVPHRRTCARLGFPRSLWPRDPIAPEPKAAVVASDAFRAEVAARIAEEKAANLAAMVRPKPADDGRGWLREALKRERDREKGRGTWGSAVRVSDATVATPGTPEAP